MSADLAEPAGPHFPGEYERLALRNAVRDAASAVVELFRVPQTVEWLNNHLTPAHTEAIRAKKESA